MTARETHKAIEAIFRIERASLIAGLARVVRNVDLAEEPAQDALVIALSEWPRTGVPASPGAWLMTVAKRRAIDAIRRDKMRERKHEEIARELEGEFDGTAEVFHVAMNDDLGDELLGLIFTACHPVRLRDLVRTAPDSGRRCRWGRARQAVLDHRSFRPDGARPARGRRLDAARAGGVATGSALYAVTVR